MSASARDHHLASTGPSTWLIWPRRPTRRRWWQLGIPHTRPTRSLADTHPHHTHARSHAHTLTHAYTLAHTRVGTDAGAQTRARHTHTHTTHTDPFIHPCTPTRTPTVPARPPTHPPTPTPTPPPSTHTSDKPRDHAVYERGPAPCKYAPAECGGGTVMREGRHGECVRGLVLTQNEAAQELLLVCVGTV